MRFKCWDAMPQYVSCWMVRWSGPCKVLAALMEKERDWCVDSSGWENWLQDLEQNLNVLCLNHLCCCYGSLIFKHVSISDVHLKLWVLSSSEIRPWTYFLEIDRNIDVTADFFFFFVLSKKLCKRILNCVNICITEVPRHAQRCKVWQICRVNFF